VALAEIRSWSLQQVLWKNIDRIRPSFSASCGSENLDGPGARAASFAGRQWNCGQPGICMEK